jgi:hypothetical protein
MKTLTFSGFIKGDFTQSWFTIKLIQDDGYKIDLVRRFQEAMESCNSNKISVRYYLSDKKCDKDEMVYGWLKKISGFGDVSFDKNDYAYSEWTSGTDYDTNFRVGNHDLLKELQVADGKYLILEIDVHEQK